MRKDAFLKFNWSIFKTALLKIEQRFPSPYITETLNRIS